MEAACKKSFFWVLISNVVHNKVLILVREAPSLLNLLIFYFTITTPYVQFQFPLTKTQNSSDPLYFEQFDVCVVPEKKDIA